MTGKIDKERREAFRVDDSLPLIIRNIREDLSPASLERVMDVPEDPSPSVLQKENISPYLWKMLTGLNQKLDYILDRLPVDILSAGSQPVNLSSTGMRVKVKKNLNLDQQVRIKMLLPTLPVKEIVLDGKVVRIETLAEGDHEVAFNFQEMNEEIKNAILHYTLNRQRKDISAKRLKKGDEEST
jgi:hypothetical protein